MTRVLILTASVGEGHDLPARTLADRIACEVPGVRILYTSGYTDAAAEGPFIQKPFTPAQLVEKVSDVLATSF